MNTAILETLESKGVKLHAVFVPAGKYADDGWRSKSINHIVTVTRGRSYIITPYSQGIEHHPLYKQGDKSLDYAEAMKGSIEDGRAHSPATRSGLPKKLPWPSLVDVMHSLVMDSSCDLDSFESFCSDFGYDTDSRSAKKTYKACRNIKLKMLSMFSAAELEELQTLFQDY